MMGRYSKAHDLDSWLRDPRIAERGFAHRWESEVAVGNGEDAFLSLVDSHLGQESRVLDVGCGHGELTLWCAERCHSAIGIDREEGYIELARDLAVERQLPGVQFLAVDLSVVRTGCSTAIPLSDSSVDLFVNRHGPVLARYLSEALRLSRPGAVIVGLHPAGTAPTPNWSADLPAAFRDVFKALPYSEVASWVTEPLWEAGITEYSLWWIDVPERLRTPRELYLRLVAHAKEPPTFDAVEREFAGIFDTHASKAGVTLRHQRLLWWADLRPM